MRPNPFRGLSPSFGVAISASMDLSREIFALRHSLRAVCEFELGRPGERGEKSWERFFDEQE